VCSAETTRTPSGTISALGHAEHAGRLAADRGGQRHGGVYEQLAGLERLAEIGEVLGLIAEGNAQHHDRRARHRGGILASGHGDTTARVGVTGRIRAPVRAATGLASGHSLPDAFARLFSEFPRPLRVARSDRHRDSRARQPQRQPEAQRPRPADDRDRCRLGAHGGGV
jgi:hypothetical protein